MITSYGKYILCDGTSVWLPLSPTTATGSILGARYVFPPTRTPPCSLTNGPALSKLYHSTKILEEKNVIGPSINSSVFPGAVLLLKGLRAKISQILQLPLVHSKYFSTLLH